MGPPANEVGEAWLVALENRQGPTALALTRQAVPTLDRQICSPPTGLRKGAYVLADLGDGTPRIILMASGSEVSIILEAAQRLAQEGVACRVVSFPSWELFLAQDEAYQKEMLPPEIGARLALEAGVTQGWERWVGTQGKVIGLNRFGASAPYKTLYEKFGLTAERVVAEAKALLEKASAREGSV
jgi:transketolase